MPRPLSSAQIRRAEVNLRAAGHRNVKVDGRLTAGEKRAVAAVQRATGHQATGKLDTGTRRELAQVAAWTKGHSDFTPGEKSTAIRNAERRLGVLGYRTGKVDGVLDQSTAKALKAFKRDQFDVDAKNGRLDRNTAQYLKAARAGRNTSPETAARRAENVLLGSQPYTDAEIGSDVFRDGADVNTVDDRSKSPRHRAAAKELARNVVPQKKALAALSPADRAAYQSARKALKAQQDPVAALGLQKLLFEGKFAGALGQQLGALASGGAALHPSVNRGQLLADLVQECATPTAISQGPIGSCGATSIAMDFAMRDPAEYARLAIGVASPGGTVTMRGGMNLVRPAGTENDDGSGRSSVQRMLGSAMYEISNGDATYSGVGDSSGSTYPGMRTLLSQLHGRPFEATWFGSGMPPGTSAAGLQGIRELLANGQRPIAALAWPDPQSAHALCVTGASNGFVTLVNPWGREERIPESVFLERLQGLEFDPAAVSPETLKAMMPFGRTF